MNPYVTPSLYRTMGFGVDLSSMEDPELSRQLSVASGLVDRFCNAPQSFDFRGGSITDEEHPWEPSNGYAPGTLRLWPNHRPIKACSSFQIHVTNTQYLNVPAGNLHVNKKPSYIEPVIAASSIGVWSYSAIPVAGYVKPIAKVSYTYGYEFSSADEILFPDGGLVFRAANQWWVEAPSSVKKNGVALTVTTDYAYDLSEGTITLVNAFDYDDVITASYTFKLPGDIRDAVAMVCTQLLGNRAIVEAGMQGISGIKIEEVEIRQSRDAQSAKTEISGLAEQLLIPYRWMGFA